jgi:DNA-binding IscR family transcriptional regulator
MTETQRAVIERLLTDSMTSKELSAELHINHSVLNNVMRAMVRNGWLNLKNDEYSLAKDYQPPLSWNFKPLLEVWQ